MKNKQLELENICGYYDIAEIEKEEQLNKEKQKNIKYKIPFYFVQEMRNGKKSDIYSGYFGKHGKWVDFGYDSDNWFWVTMGNGYLDKNKAKALAKRWNANGHNWYKNNYDKENNICYSYCVRTLYINFKTKDDMEYFVNRCLKYQYDEKTIDKILRG